MNTNRAIQQANVRHLSRGCGSKIAYPSKRQAHGGVRAHIATHGTAGYAVEAYKCKTCGAWHIGHNRWRPSRPPLMDPVLRRQLIEAPLSIRTIGSHFAGSGTSLLGLGGALPVGGRRVGRASVPYDHNVDDGAFV